MKINSFKNFFFLFIVFLLVGCSATNKKLIHPANVTDDSMYAKHTDKQKSDYVPLPNEVVDRIIEGDLFILCVLPQDPADRIVKEFIISEFHKEWERISANFSHDPLSIISKNKAKLPWSSVKPYLQNKTLFGVITRSKKFGPWELAKKQDLVNRTIHYWRNVGEDDFNNPLILVNAKNPSETWRINRH